MEKRGPLQERIESKLQGALAPEQLTVENESHRHAVKPGSETHFKVLVVSKSFLGQNAVARHRAVYGTLAEELKDGVHALSLDLCTPDEWAARSGLRPSPPCASGKKTGGETR